MMSTDEIRDAFHSVFERAVGDVTADPALLSVVRRRHARRQRLLTIGAPLGVAAITASALVGAAASHSGNGGDLAAAGPSDGSTTSQPTQTSQTTQPALRLQTVSLVGHDISLPSDWRLSGNRQLIDLDVSDLGDLVGGKDQSVAATSPDGTRRFQATVYSGAIGDAERSHENAADDPTWAHVAINGSQASIKVSGPPTTCISMAPSGQGQGQGQPVEGPCPPDVVAPHPPYGEARYVFGNGDFMMVDTNGMGTEALADFLVTALSG
jgi:hypothetical protein